jgi:hypothetical protein
MGIVLLLSFFLSSRTVTPDGAVVDRVFPAVRLVHPEGAGTFVPGSFALAFFSVSTRGWSS